MTSDDFTKGLIELYKLGYKHGFENASKSASNVKYANPIKPVTERAGENDG